MNIFGIFKHRHRWKPSAFNVFQIAVEQRCRCGQFRHISQAPGASILGDSWDDGEHPNAAKLRKAGVL